MEKQRRREIASAYKERKVVQGVFAVRCAPTGEVWLGLSRNLPAQQNSVWFGLRQGTHRNKGLQASWTAHGEVAFELVVVEEVDTEGLSPALREGRLKERLAARLADTPGARPIVA